MSAELVDRTSSLEDLLALAEPAPAEATALRGPGLGTEQMIALAAPLLVRSFVAGREITAGEVWKGVPLLASSYKSANALGTALSRGVGENGLHLWAGSKGYAACQQNAGLALKALSAEDRAALLDEMSVEELAEAISKLPVAPA